MNHWLERSLAPLRAVPSGVVVVLDRDDVADSEGLLGNELKADNWWQLRAHYENHCRRRAIDRSCVILHVVGILASQTLPWDVEQSAELVVDLRLPGPLAVRMALKQLTAEEMDRAIIAVEANLGDPARAFIASVSGVSLAQGALSRMDQLRVGARISTRHPPGPIRDLARAYVDDHFVRGLLDDPSDASALQERWGSFVGGNAEDWASVFDVARLEVGQLFAAGLLEPIPVPTVPTTWSAVGLRNQTDAERATELIEVPPVELPPTDSAGWSVVAEWWGDIRRLTARASREQRERAWEQWAELDQAFLPWTLQRYGGVLSSAAQWPPSVHRVAPHLARRLDNGDADRLLLIVLDGLGHAQWHHLVERLPMRIAEAGSTFAMVPTYTTVSRQAIFAGDLPMSFADSLWTTRLEPRRWATFWRNRGVPDGDVSYHRVRGRLPHDVIQLDRSRVVGVVVNAVDDLMHSSDLFGDAQLLANLDVWVSNGFLDDLLRRAKENGFETWITADHGNLECRPAGSVSEGLAVEAAGKRLLRYSNRTLRDSSTVDGIVWDDIPGMPGTDEALRIAPHRLAYTNDLVSVSHGGLSFDELIVPLVRLES